MSDDNIVPLPVIKIERWEDGNPQKCAPGQPGSMVTPDGDILCVGVPSAMEALSPEFAALDIDNMREWVQAALEAKGAKIVGAGIGCGGTMGIADIQIELEGGHQCNIEIRPL